MKLFAVVLGALALLTGFVGGMRAYSAAVPPPTVTARETVPHHPRAQPVRPGPTFAWAPCRRPAVREGKVCVIHVTRTVAMPAAAGTAPPAPPAQPAPQVAPQHAAPTHSPSAAQHRGGAPHGDHGGRHDD